MLQTTLSAVRREFDSISLRGKRAVVVGATSGIGEGIALRLARANCQVTIVGRDKTRGDAVLARLQNASSDDAAKSSHRFERLDASLIAQCRKFAREFVGPIDLLVMTQGIGSFAGFSPTSENIDRKMALHYFSRAALALEFAPRLAQSDDGRVLTVLTPGVHAPYADFETDFDLSKNFSLSKAASACCFYNDIAAEKLNAEFPSLTVTHAAPGFVASSLGSDLPFYIRWPTRFAQLFATSIEDCGEMLATSLFRPAPFRGHWHLLDSKCGTVPPTSLHDAAKDVVRAKTKALINSVPQ